MRTKNGLAYPYIKSLDQFVRSEYWHNWDSENRSPGSAGMILSDPDRFDRIMEAAEEGCDGSTHYEIISDWRDALTNAPISECAKEKIIREIDACEDWHEKNGSLFDAIG